MIKKTILFLLIISLFITGCTENTMITDNTLKYDVLPYEEYEVVTMTHNRFADPAYPLIEYMITLQRCIMMPIMLLKVRLLVQSYTKVGVDMKIYQIFIVNL